MAEDLSVLHRSDPDATRTDATLECQECGHVFKDELVELEDVSVDAVLSEDDESEAATLEVPPNEAIAVGDELFDHGHRLLVTGLELEEEGRVDEATPDELGTVWCKVFDTVTVPVSVNQGHKTWTGELEVAPEEPFFVGDRLMLKDREVEVHAMKAGQEIHHEGRRKARDIRRLYAKPLDGEPIRFEEVHRTEIFRSRKASEGDTA